MKKLTVDEIKEVEFGILKTVADYCDANNIRYYLAFGTLLGAVRHKGFIPWDDDIDLVMPREDYQKFVTHFPFSESRYIVKSIEIDKSYWNPFAKVMDTRTYMKDPQVDIPNRYNCVNIDIFPMDGLPKSELRIKIHLKFQEFLIALYRASAFKLAPSLKYADSKSKIAFLKGKIRNIIKYAAIIILKPLPTQSLISLINKNAKKYKFSESLYVEEAVNDALFRAIRKEDFLPRTKYEFEKALFWGPQNYDIYLKSIYGDYMTPPPLESQVSHHSFEAYFVGDKI